MKQKTSIAIAVQRQTANFKAATLAGVLLLSSPIISSAQAVTGIITDYKGYWKTAIGSVNSQKPDNSHNMLAFTYKGVQYSTGVNDPLLTSKGETYTASDFWSLPVGQLSGNLNSNTKAGFGALYDGVHAGPSVVPPAYGISEYITDGIKGLNIGTCIANLPKGTMTFSISHIDPLSIGDGIPDIVVTQIADPSGTYDRYDFTDENGARVGGYMDIIFTNISPVATWTADFYEAKVNPLNLIPGYTQTDRPMRLWAADLSEFGVTVANCTQIRNFRIDLSGQSDVAFVAYNNRSVDFKNALPVQYNFFKGGASNGQVNLNWQTASEQDAEKFVVERSNDGINFHAIGTVPANNNATTVNNYRFNDASPLPGKSYYRLKQVDLNGKHHNNSSIIKINASKNNTPELNVYPNPAKGKVYVDHADAKEEATITLHNVSGMTIKQQRVADNVTTTMLDLGSVPSGIYYVSFNSGGTKTTTRFVIN